MKRSEEDIIAMASFEVQLGAQKYPIKPLTILAQRAWRAKLSEELVPIVESFSQQANEKAMLTGLAASLVNFPEKLASLVFSYAPDLDQDKILAEATEEQLAVAFSSIMVVAFPFLAQLGLVTQLVRATTATR